MERDVYIERAATTGHAAETSLEELLTFERLLGELSARFANVSGDQVETEIEGALKQLLKFLGFDRSNFAEFTADGWATILCSSAADGVERYPTGPAPSYLGWYLGQIRAGKLMRVHSIDDLPPKRSNKSNTVAGPVSGPVSESRSVSVATLSALSTFRRSAPRGNGRMTSPRG